jgi:hypothetical protein
MKNYLLFLGIVTFLLCFNNINAQSKKKQKALTHIIYNENVNEPLTVKERAQLKEAYGDEFETYVLKHTQYLKDLKNLLRNRIFIEEHKNKDLSQLKSISEVPLRKKGTFSVFSDIENFNPLLYEFNFFSRYNKSYYYWIDNTNYMLIIKPQHQ